MLNSGSSDHCPKGNNQEASVSRKERCFRQKGQQSGEKVDLCLEIISADSVKLLQLLFFLLLKYNFKKVNMGLPWWSSG